MGRHVCLRNKSLWVRVPSPKGILVIDGFFFLIKKSKINK